MQEKITKLEVEYVTALCDCGSEINPYRKFFHGEPENGIICPSCGRTEVTPIMYPFYRLAEGAGPSELAEALANLSRDLSQPIAMLYPPKRS